MSPQHRQKCFPFPVETPNLLQWGGCMLPGGFRPIAAGLSMWLLGEIHKIAGLSIALVWRGYIPLAAELPNALKGRINPAYLLIIGRACRRGRCNLVLVVQLADGLVCRFDLLLLRGNGNGEFLFYYNTIPACPVP